MLSIVCWQESTLLHTLNHSSSLQAVGVYVLGAPLCLGFGNHMKLTALVLIGTDALLLHHFIADQVVLTVCS